MPVSVEQFIDRLTASGLMTSAQTSLLGDEHVAEDGESMASELVAQGLLTRYQADAVCTGQVEHLILGGYTILDQIGEGGMGQVFKALHSRLDRLAAIKILPASALHDRMSIDRFYQEVRIAAQIAHPNIVITYDAGEQNGIHYLVMEYVDGQDVAAVLAEQGPFGVAQAIDVFLQTARGLEYAHSSGIVHRDVKPGNLLLDNQGHVKILDMGLARMATKATPRDATAAERLTNVGQVMGTLDYMPPEQAENAKQADARSDIYALGCTLYRMLVGNVPYPSESVVESIMSHREAKIPSLRSHRPDVPEWLDHVCRKCINKRPDDRYQTVTELIQDVEANQQRSDFLTRSVKKIRNAASLLGLLVESSRDEVASQTGTVGDTVPFGSARHDTSKERLVPIDQGPVHQGVARRVDQHVDPPLATLVERHDLPNSSAQQAIHPRTGRRIRRLRSHHGTRVVILGVLGIYFSSNLFGVVFGLAAALMGKRDLGKMKTGRMNAQGRTSTTIGMALGIAAVVLVIIRSLWN